MDKVKLIKEIKNYVQGINLVQVRFRVPHSPLPTATDSSQADPGPDWVLTLLSGRQRSWWNPCLRKSKPTWPRPRPRRSRRLLEAVGGTVVLE